MQSVCPWECRPRSTPARVPLQNARHLIKREDCVAFPDCPKRLARMWAPMDISRTTPLEQFSNVTTSSSFCFHPSCPSSSSDIVQNTLLPIKVTSRLRPAPLTPDPASSAPTSLPYCPAKSQALILCSTTRPSLPLRSHGTLHMFVCVSFPMTTSVVAFGGKTLDASSHARHL